MTRGRSSIAFDPATMTWAIDMANSTYGLGSVGGGTGLGHLHWGAPISLSDLSGGARPPRDVLNARQTSWGADDPLECVAFGGWRYDEPSLKVEYPDGTRAIEWHVGAHRTERITDAVSLEVDLTDDTYPLTMTLCYRVFDGEDVIERWARVTNTGKTGPIMLHQVYSADWWLAPGVRWRLRYLHGGWARETQIVETAPGPGKIVLESRRGTTSHQLGPWFAIGAEDGTSEERGEIWSGAIAWSGSWKIVFETTPGGRHHVCGGWNDFDSPLVLAPGAELALPVFAGCYSPAGFGGSSRAWHQYQRRHVLANEARTGGSPSFPRRQQRSNAVPKLRPVLYNSWEATGFSVDEEGQLRLAELAARIGAELFVLDDGWFRGRADDHAGLGDWYVDQHKFPRGLGPLIDGVHQLGLGFGLWLEPEMVNPDSDLYREHPDWVYHFENRSRSEARNQLVLNLARPDVAEWLYRTLDRVLSDNKIDFVKWDMNRHFSEPGWPAMSGDNPERIWVGHVRNLYDVLERVRRAHPGVAFESCSGGGGRVDLGILSRVEQVWTSDNTDAWDRVAIQEGFSQVYTPMSMMAWVTDSPNPLTARRLPLSYRFHVAMSGSLGIGGDLARWSPAELDEARELVATYKSVRHIVQLGRLYRLASTRGGPLAAVQYLTDDGDEAVVLAYWGVRHYGPYRVRLPLAALDPEARYVDVVTGAQRSGAALMRFGVELGGPLDFGSALFHLRRLPRSQR
jgi:alpha-galactosidase